MDSCNFQFERMSNIDLHPLSLPMSRLSPAKSNSSIADQFVHHHQHGKGDSAYSSFSGGSTAPDYPSPFLPDDLHSNSFSHYADLKYVKSLYNPSQVLQSDPKTMDQLYRSVEAISQQYRHSNSNLSHYNGSESAYVSNRTFSKQDTASQAGFITHNPPPIPTRLDSFIATKNLENTRAHHESQQLQSPRQQYEKSNVKTEAYRRASQPPSYHLQHLTNSQAITQTNPEYFAINSNNKLEQSKIGKNLSQSPPKGANQMEQLKQKQSQNTQMDSQVKNNRNSLENHRRRAHSTNDFFGSDSQREYRSWSIGQSVVNSSIQHKGQFYFVTGVCKTTPDSEIRQHSTSLCGSESANELETYKLRERCHSTMENLFRPLQPSPCVVPSDDRSFVNVSKTNNVVNMCEENLRKSLSKSSRSLEALEEIDVTQSRDIGRHTPNNPIFYCGPERTSPLQQTKEVANLSNEQLKHVREEQAKRVNRQSLGDVASERINKETTPLLYQLTGASRAGFKTEAKTGTLDVINEPLSNNTAIDAACNTLDHSYKKFYREQLKDVQSRVLRETSFKRRDLQLSRPHRVRERSDTKPALVQEARPTAVHQFTPSQDSETSTETLTPSITSEDTEKGSIKEAVDIEPPKQVEKESEKENNRHANVAQPQVPRIGGRKRLTPEQKKMCFSEPEKLHQIGRGAVSHSSCRSFGNESENDFTMEQEADDSVLQTGPGFVAARRKVFETRGRALSASSASKSSLKHLQHKALVEYMERKTGQKVAEPQQPAPQVPAGTRQRHSLGEKPFDWGARPQSGPQESKKKRLNRPHSAGRILDSSTSSIRYAQFFSNQSSSGQSCGQLYQPKCRQSRGPSQGKSASVEDLLDQPENRSFYRNRSTSSPHPFQAFEPVQDPLLVNDTKETGSSHKDVTEDSPVKAEGQQPVRVVAQRGKSMEELGATKFTRPKALSKSTEQLDQLCRHSTRAEPELEKRTTSKSLEMVKNADSQQEQQQQQITQGPPNQTRKKSPVKQNSEPILGGKDDDDLGCSKDTSASPGSCSSTRTRIHSHGAVPNEAWSRTNPADSPRGHDPGEREMKSSSSSPTQTKSSYENRPSPRTRSPASASEIEESVDNPSSSDLPPPPPLDPNQEVSLSCGVTTDPSLWPPPPPPPSSEDQLTQDVPNPSLTETVTSEPSLSTPPTETSTTVSPSTSVSDLDLTPQVNEEKTSQNNNENLDQQNPDLEERGTPEGETEVQETPAEKPQWEELVVAVVKADQSLARALYPLANRKTALMLMEQLLSEDTLLMEEHYKKKQEQRGESVEVGEITEAFTCPSSQSLDVQNKADVKEKKRLLVSYIEERLLSLADTRACLQTEMEENRVCGEVLQGLVRERCSPVELERYNLFMGDLERVVSLLLCLSARLARVQNALSTVDQHTDAEEKESLDSRHRLLCKQRDDAKDLKDNLDRRESQVSAFLSRQLSPEQLQDYKRFVQTKASLLIRQKDLEERQRLGEEQLEALSHCLK